jgi:4-hydroxybenzoate polyprenyltransferase
MERSLQDISTPDAGWRDRDWLEAEAALEPVMRDWLTLRGQLTNALRAAWLGAFSLERLGESEVSLSADEAGRLGVARGPGWAREVQMTAGGHVLVIARSVAPALTLEACPWLREIGDAPLGEALEAHAPTERDEFEYRAFAAGENAPGTLGMVPPPGPAWARRSVFVNADAGPHRSAETRQLARQAYAYARLMRLDRPIGIWLLMWPTLWALWIAGEGRPDPHVFIVFVVGVVLMRSAGCAINDFADRHVDGEVRRTRDRPLAVGEVSATEALLLFAGLSLIAFGLVLTLNRLTIWLAIAGAALAVVYPFAKRYIATPQIVLGAAFGWSVPMAFAAQTGELGRLPWLLFLCVLIWAVVYDTMYAMVDRQDDLRIGVKSTAILFGEADRMIIGALQLTLLVGLFLVGERAGLGGWYNAGLAVAGVLALYQQWLIRDRHPQSCFRAFLNNHPFGGAVFAGILLHYTFT